MNSFLRIRPIAAAAVLGALIFSGASVRAQTPTSAQQAAIEPLAKQYFSSVVSANLAGIQEVTTPNFTVTTPAGKTLTASELVAQVKQLRFMYGNVAASGQLVSTAAGANRITSTVTLETSAAPLTPEGGPPGGRAVRDSVHSLLWVNTANGWKLASDKIVSSQVRKVP